MPFFAYKAADADGKVVRGSLEAHDEKGVVSALHNMGCIPMRISRSDKQAGLAGSLLKMDLATLFNRIKGKDVLLFTQDLAALLTAGLPVDRSLSILIDVAEKPKFKEIIREILKAVQGGSYLSDALGQYPNVFSRFYINMVRAGEAGGVLEAVLIRMGTFLESAEDLKDFIKSALVYPAFLVFVGGISMIILLAFVIPKFSVIFADMGVAVPLSTRVLLAFSSFLRHFWWVMAIVMGLVWYQYLRYSRSPTGRLQLDRLRVRMPVVGEFVRKIEMARFARTLGTLIRSGVPILQALVLVKDIIGNQVVAGAMEDIHARVKEGERLSAPLADSGMFPSLAVQMIMVGEETGKLDEMLLSVGENYEKMVRNLVKRFISLLEPAMILLMGLVVGFIVISMLLGIFSMNEIPF